MKSSEFLKEDTGTTAPNSDGLPPDAPLSDEPPAAAPAPKRPNGMMQGVSDWWGNNFGAAGQAASANKAATDATVKVLLSNWLSAAGGLDPQDIDVYRRSFGDWIDRERTLRFADPLVIQKAINSVNPANIQTISRAINSVFGSAKLARATSVHPERLEKMEKFRKEKEDQEIKNAIDFEQRTASMARAAAVDPQAIAKNMRSKGVLGTTPLAKGVELVNADPMLFRFNGAIWAIGDKGRWFNLKTKVVADAQIQDFLSQQQRRSYEAGLA